MYLVTFECLRIINESCEYIQYIIGRYIEFIHIYISSNHTKLQSTALENTLGNSRYFK